MEIVDLSPEHEGLYCLCLEDWSDEIREAGDHKARWYERMKQRGLRVKLARDDQGVIGGMIQYLPIEHSFLEGRDLNFVYCVWVHGYKQGRGNFQGRGMGKALLAAAEEDTRAQGKKGLAAWGVALPVFMKASWFKRQGYKRGRSDWYPGAPVEAFRRGRRAAQVDSAEEAPAGHPGPGHGECLRQRLVPGAEPRVRAGAPGRGGARRAGAV